MTVRPGEPWGEPGELPAGAPCVDTDAELAALVSRHGAGAVVAGLRGGDLHRTIGAPPPERMSGPRAHRFPIDALAVRLDGGAERWAVAHVVAGDPRWFRRRTAVVMNAAFVGAANLGPRAHPGDGLADVTDGALGWREQRRAAARWGAGAHIPHPRLDVRRVREWSVEFDTPVEVWLDGLGAGRARTVDVRVVADALVVVA